MPRQPIAASDAEDGRFVLRAPVGEARLAP
jgi:hypothetical protein